MGDPSKRKKKALSQLIGVFEDGNAINFSVIETAFSRASRRNLEKAADYLSDAVAESYPASILDPTYIFAQQRMLRVKKDVGEEAYSVIREIAVDHPFTEIAAVWNDYGEVLNLLGELEIPLSLCNELLHGIDAVGQLRHPTSFKLFVQLLEHESQRKELAKFFSGEPSFLREHGKRVRALRKETDSISSNQQAYDRYPDLMMRALGTIFPVTTDEYADLEGKGTVGMELELNTENLMDAVSTNRGKFIGDHWKVGSDLDNLEVRRVKGQKGQESLDVRSYPESLAKLHRWIEKNDSYAPAGFHLHLDADQHNCPKLGSVMGNSSGGFASYNELDTWEIRGLGVPLGDKFLGVRALRSVDMRTINPTLILNTIFFLLAASKVENNYQYEVVDQLHIEGELDDVSVQALLFAIFHDLVPATTESLYLLRHPFLMRAFSPTQIFRWLDADSTKRFTSFLQREYPASQYQLNQIKNYEKLDLLRNELTSNISNGKLIMDSRSLTSLLDRLFPVQVNSDIRSIDLSKHIINVVSESQEEVIDLFMQSLQSSFAYSSFPEKLLLLNSVMEMVNHDARGLAHLELLKRVIVSLIEPYEANDVTQEFVLRQLITLNQMGGRLLALDFKDFRNAFDELIDNDELSDSVDWLYEAGIFSW